MKLRSKSLVRILITLLFVSLVIFLYNTNSLWTRTTKESNEEKHELNNVIGFHKDSALNAARPQSQNGLSNTDAKLKYMPERAPAKVDICTLDLLEILDEKRQKSSTNQLTNGASSSSKIKVNNDDTLHVIVLPHSHSDPGWLKTLDDYFLDQTKKTLNNMVVKLMKYPDMTFVWSEVVFLSMWWKGLDKDIRMEVKRLIDRRQLEIAPGSWVVPDEANAHYYALIDQMILGHQWLEENLNVRPNNTWSLDPFGYSALLPYLYKSAGFKNMAILRVHKDVKSELESRKALEFYWRQSWDSTNHTDVFTLMMPYMLYNIKHSCGPDQMTCLKFDFRKIPGEFSEARAELINPSNAEALAELLLDQYRKKASLYKHNVVLVPLGDDFRYDRPLEWDQQYVNYKKLFKAINSRKDWNARVRFGTLQDYYEQVSQVVKLKQVNTKQSFFPSLSGDFFPYTDHNEEYWTGYFSTRPVAKSLGRDVEVNLRAAEILNSLAHFTQPAAHGSTGRYDLNRNVNRLINSRQSSALFQHHDAITGTAKFYVANDYEKRLNGALNDTQAVIRDAMNAFYSSAKESKNMEIRILDPVNKRILKPMMSVVNIPPEGLKIIVYNSVTHNRKDLIKLIINAPSVTVTNRDKWVIPSQILPVLNKHHQRHEDVFELAFLADLPPLSFTTFTIVPSKAGKSCTQSIVEQFNMVSNTSEVSTGEVFIENDLFKIAMSTSTGQLMYIINKHSSQKINVNIQFLTYKSRRSGAYIFGPTGPATADLFKVTPRITRIVGPVVSELHVSHPSVNHVIRVVNTTGFIGGAIAVENIADVLSFSDDELIMRLKSDIDDKGFYFTDQNAHHSVRRKRLRHLPIEANYYPVSSAIYMEDTRRRLTVITAQPVGGSSQEGGSMEVMIGRSLRFDDGRGMGEGVMDTRPSVSRFLIMAEERQNPDQKYCENCVSSPTLPAHVLTEYSRNYPVVATIRSGVTELPAQSFLTSPLPCDVSLISLRVLGADGLNKDVFSANDIKEAVLVLHKHEYSIQYSVPIVTSECPISAGDSVVVDDLLKNVKVRSVKLMSLSLMHEIAKLKPKEAIALLPNELYSFQCSFLL